MESKSKGNENKIMLEDFNCTMDKMDRNSGNKSQRLYRCSSKYALSKLTVDNDHKDLQEMENPDSSEFIYYDRSSGKKSRIHRVYTDIKIANKSKINHILVSFTDHYNSISLEIPLSEIKIGKDT